MRIDEKDVTQDSVVPPAEAPPQTRREDIQLLDDEDNYMPPPEAVQPMGVGGGAPEPAAVRLLDRDIYIHLVNVDRRTSMDSTSLTEKRGSSVTHAQWSLRPLILR